jgi:glycogen debranching enzyme
LGGHTAHRQARRDQALWINALRIAGRRSARWAALGSHAQATFAERFWNEQRGFLFDVVDVGHQGGVNDASLRPNQIFAVGGLPFPSSMSSGLAAWWRSSSTSSGRPQEFAR